MKKVCFLLILGTVSLAPCFSQNMLMLGGEYNFFKPQLWGAGLGFNLKLFNEYIQNDLTVNFGNLWAKEAIVEIESEETETVITEGGDVRKRFFFSLRDSLYFTLEGDWVGLRAGIFASLGLYQIVEFPTAYDLFANGGAFAGIVILPKSLFSVALDLCPGYLIAFRFKEGVSKNDEGFSLSLSLSIRFNLDKL